MSEALGAVYSAADSFKRKLIDALRNPGATVDQIKGRMVDDLRGAREQLRAASDEGPATYGPASRALAMKMADAYNPAGITVWHGSGNLFPKFDVTRAPTNGFAYTRGAYTAGARDEAKGYSPRDPAYEERLVKLYNDASRKQDYTAMEVLEGAMLHQSPKELMSQFANPENYDPAFIRRASQVIRDVEKLPNKSYLYKVDLKDEVVPKLLQFDEPLSAQTNPSVQQLAQELGMNHPNEWLGGDVIGRLRSRGVTDMEIPKALREKGIPGLAYDSQQVRGSKNYVSYDPEMLQILEVNDRPAEELIKALRKRK